MVRLLGISGSLRKESFNSHLLRAAAASMPAGAHLEIGSIRGIPLYDGDIEASGIPAAVGSLKDAIAGADGLVIATPEYNHSIPGVLKNALDWLSRSHEDVERVFVGKPVALMGATIGRSGTANAQKSLMPILQLLGTRPWNEAEFLVSGAHHVFGSDGQLVDQRVAAALSNFMLGFVSFTRQPILAETA